MNTSPGSISTRCIREVSLLPALLLLLALILFPNRAQAQVLDNKPIEPLVHDYLLWTDLNLASKPEARRMEQQGAKPGFEMSELRRILHPDCRIYYGMGPDEEPKSVKDFTKLIGQMRFMTDASGTIVEGPAYDIVGDQAKVTVSQLLTDSQAERILTTTLLIRSTTGGLRVFEVHREYRAPTDAEHKLAISANQRAGYDPNRGFGARYLGGGCFYAGPPCFTPDGSRIVFGRAVGENCDLYSIRPDGTGEDRLTSTTAWEINPRFIPDGKSLLFRSDVENYSGEPYSIPTNSTFPVTEISANHRLLPDLDNCGLPVYSANDATMAFVVGKDTSLRVEIQSANQRVDPSLEGNSFYSGPVITRDGALVLFSGVRPSSPGQQRSIELFSIRSSGLDLKKLTNSGAKKYVCGISTSPERIVYMRADEKYDSNVWWCAMDGSDEIQLTHHDAGGVYLLTVAPNGRLLAYTSSHNLFILSLEDTAKPIALTNGPGSVATFTFSPDSKSIALIMDKEGQRCGLGDLCLVSTSGGPLRTLTRNY